MSEDRFKISLRTRRKPRPTIGAPQQIAKAPPQNGAPPASRTPGGNTSLAVPGSGGKTSDLVKRRYSTRFNNPPAGYDASTPTPLMPTMPIIKGHTGRGPAVKLDMRALQDPKLQADKYVANILANASEQDIEDYRQQLKMIRNETSVDLQQNVYQNLAEFIKISRETQKLKGEMRVLRNLMSELKDNVGALRSASTSVQGGETVSGGGMSTSKRDKRSSVLDRSQIWNTHLQEMWKSIAGSQKFLPAAPGRHVIQDAGNWLELDPATWKPRREMRIFLLNDHLLVASRKKPSAQDGEKGANQLGRERLVADRCWPLLDIEMVDLASTTTASPSSKNNVTNAIMVRGVGHDSFTYQIENPSTNGKATLLLNFRKAAEELRKGLWLEIESSTKSKDTVNYFASRDPGLRKSAALLESISAMKDRPDMLIEVDGKQQNIRWVEGQIDELDIDIALQRFEEAVARVESLKGLAKGLKNNALAQDFINLKADERALKLADLINHELIATNHELSKTKRNVNWLSRLGFDNRARESYLSARSQLIEKRFRQCIFEGDFQQYIWEISFVYFTLIKNTVVAFKGCFPTVMMSACVEWARERVEELNSVLLGQLGEKRDGERRWVETMNQVKEHARILGEVGLDFGHLIGRREINAQVV